MSTIIEQYHVTKQAEERAAKARMDERHLAMLADLHARCEAKKEALREERFWNEVMEEAQGIDFPY